ncbi:MAG: hypothetical protein ACLFNK_04545 [Candidatus Woesearchaeota archaeon]
MSHLNEQPIYAIEGPDGAGKTSVVDELSGVEGIITAKTPSKRYRENRELYDSGFVSAAERFRFYRDGISDVFNEIDFDSISQSDSLVLDRYTISLGLYHNILSNSGRFPISEITNNLPVARAHIILIPDEDDMFRRISERYSERTDHHMETDKAFLKKIRNGYSAISGKNVFKIDSTEKDLSEVVDECLRIIQMTR